MPSHRATLTEGETNMPNLVNLWALYYAPYPERRARMRRHLRQQTTDTAPRGRGHKAHRRVDALLRQPLERLME